MNISITHHNAIAELARLANQRAKCSLFTLGANDSIVRHCRRDAGPAELLSLRPVSIAVRTNDPTLAGKVDEIGFDEYGEAWFVEEQGTSIYSGLLVEKAADLDAGNWSTLRALADRVQRALMLRAATVRPSYRSIPRSSIPPGFSLAPIALRDRLRGYCLAGVGEQIDRKDAYAKLLSRGQLFDLPVRLIAGSTGECHQNSLRYWADRPAECSVATGYTVDPEAGMWHQHSWIVQGGEILETTPLRGLYYGYVLSDVEAFTFFHFEIVQRNPDTELSLAMKKFLVAHGEAMSRELRQGASSAP